MQPISWKVPLTERFWRSVQKTPTCWLWTGGKQLGYGIIRYRRQIKRAHRVSWELHHGAIPEGAFVCHNCPGGDNRACVNPEHLWLGDVLSNTRDAAQKGTMRRGRTHYKARLTEEAVLEIRARYTQGETQRALATAYGVVPQTIEWIVNRKTWKHLTHSATSKIP